MLAIVQRTVDSFRKCGEEGKLFSQTQLKSQFGSVAKAQEVCNYLRQRQYKNFSNTKAT